ncbi:MAG: TonB-dependent receptor [Tannerellaceae bacterium]|jgi:TonB-linked SusC/RagA family outer membrane protein|nr:TonB-dependent receptor [Tannerellaceae bacterium]
MKKNFNTVIRVMKLTCILLLVSVGFAFAAGSYAQNKVITLNLSNRTVAEVLETIENETEFNFYYNSKLVNTSRLVSVNVNNKHVYAVLDQLFSGHGVYYKVVDRDIILTDTAGDGTKGTDGITQNKVRISGVVTDAGGEPVIGVNVVEKGTTNGTITDTDGAFSFPVSPGATLEIRYIGYMTKEIPINGNTTFSITLEEDLQALEEVVVIGYGTMKKKDLTGAIATVQGDELVTRKTMQLSGALQGTMAGVMVTRDNNEPGAAAGSIRIRGVTTIGDSSPLYIVDGVPGDINQVNPNDVESISVLKDAASASIYGSRAAAGVILITTKRARENQLALNYSFEYGAEIPTTRPEFVDVQRYMQMANELRWNDAGNGTNEYPLYAKDVIDNYYTLNAENPDIYPDTDWTDLILKSSAPRQSHLLSISGGTQRVRTKASLSYDKTDGLYADRYYGRLMTRINNDFIINNYLAAALDVNFKRSNSHRPVSGIVFDWMRFAAPVYAAIWQDGRLGEGKSGNNVYASAMYGGDRDDIYNQLGGKIAIDFTPLSGLKISAIVAPVYNFDKSKQFRKAIPYYSATDPALLMGYIEGHATTLLTETRNDSYNVTTQFLANYIKSFGKHDLTLMGGYENYYYFNESLSASRDKYELEGYPYLDIGPLELRNNGGSAYENAYRSFFGRATYSYKSKYLLQGNIRYDASSRFHEDYRWGAFPSFSAGWVLSEEGFMKDIFWLSFLKLKGSWGTLGNERIGNYPYQSTIGFANALFYAGNTVVSKQTAAQVRYAIKDISWETTESTDIGIEANFLNNRLRVSADYYYKTTRDMLLALEIPDYMGFENPDQNTGKMNTKGFDLETSWRDRTGDFSYSIMLNLSDFKSKMGDLGGTEFLGDQVKKKGSEFNEWYGYLSDGIYQTQEEVDNSARLNNNVKPGDVKYKDVSGPDGTPDGRISPEYDRVLLGGSLPHYMFGLNTQLSYKNVDFSMVFQGVGSQNVRLQSKMIQPLQVNWGHMPAILDGNYWSMYNTPEQNLAAKYPRLTYTNASNFTQMSDFYIFNGRYLRLKNITLGYSVPENVTDVVGIRSIRLYASASDLFCLSKYPKGWDPEMGVNAYPITTSVLFGLSVNF